MKEWSHVVVIGASAGGHTALQQLVSKLPEDYAPPVFIVMHLGAHDINLPQLLQKSSHLPVRYAMDNERIAPGMIRVAPPDHHLLLNNEVMRLSRAAKENFARPAIDPLFRTAAFTHHENVVGIVLTGNLDDGTVGLQAIKAYGGIAIVQDPATAEAQDMPRSALDHVEVDYCLPLDAIADKLVELAQEHLRIANTITQWIPVGSNMSLPDVPNMGDLDNIGHQSKLTCPECNGVLWEIKSHKKLHYRCQTGHSFTGESLNIAQNNALEEAIWFAIRALHEKQRLLQRLADSAREGHRDATAQEYDESATQAAQHAAVLQKVVSHRKSA